MVMNPLAFLTPQQQEVLQRIQAVSKNINAEIKTSDNQLQVWLKTDNPEAAQLVPQIQEALVNSIANTLYQMFNITGQRT
jgi:hypothetical protein